MDPLAQHQQQQAAAAAAWTPAQAAAAQAAVQAAAAQQHAAALAQLHAAHPHVFAGRPLGLPAPAPPAAPGGLHTLPRLVGLPAGFAHLTALPGFMPAPGAPGAPAFAPGALPPKVAIRPPGWPAGAGLPALGGAAAAAGRAPDSGADRPSSSHSANTSAGGLASDGSPLAGGAASGSGGTPDGSAGAKSRYRGVSYDRKKGKWRVQIKVAALGKSGVSVGYFDTEEAAARAYDRAAIGLLGLENPNLQVCVLGLGVGLWSFLFIVLA
jgi:hypothetical protein